MDEYELVDLCESTGRHWNTSREIAKSFHSLRPCLPRARGAFLGGDLLFPGDLAETLQRHKWMSQIDVFFHATHCAVSLAEILGDSLLSDFYPIAHASANRPSWSRWDLSKTKQIKTTQTKTNQTKTKQTKTNENLNKSTQIQTNQNWSKQIKSNQIETNQNKSKQIKTWQNESKQIKTNQNKSKSKQIKTNQN